MVSVNFISRIVRKTKEFGKDIKKQQAGASVRTCCFYHSGFLRNLEKSTSTMCITELYSARI